MTDFFLEEHSDDSSYRSLREGELPPEVEARTFARHLWSIAEPLLEPGFRERARKRLHPCFWEMYLAAAVARHGLPVRPWRQRRCRKEGPDVQVGDGDLWIEATAPGPGSGRDAVTELPEGEFRPVPGDLIKLRITNALDEKLRKYRDYLASGAVRPDEILVVAVNCAKVPTARMIGDPPCVVRAVYPIGPESIVIDTTTHEIRDQFYQYQPHVAKASGSRVPTTAFLSDGYEEISALISSTVDAFNPHRRFGFDFIIVHNSKASNPLPRGLLPCWREYWVEGSQLHWREGADQAKPA